MLEQVLELWDRVPDASRLAGTDHVGVVELGVGAACWSGEPERGLALVEAALPELGKARDAERAGILLLWRAGLRQDLLLPGQLDDLQEGCAWPAKRRP